MIPNSHLYIFKRDHVKPSAPLVPVDDFRQPENLVIPSPSQKRPVIKKNPMRPASPAYHFAHGYRTVNPSGNKAERLS